MARSAFNEIIPCKLYQRAQILTWAREVKLAALKERNIRVIVNFWPKVDPDLSDFPLDWYWFIPCPSSKMVLDKPTILAAETVSFYLDYNPGAALILCEAGVTRSVFFSLLVYAHQKCMTPKQALETFPMRTDKLKSFMLEYING